jgi:hypothetical protein
MTVSIFIGFYGRERIYVTPQFAHLERPLGYAAAHKTNS